MPHIVVNQEQAKMISESPECIEIRDQSGKHLGYVTPGFSEEDIAIAKQRMVSDQPRYTTQDVLGHLPLLAGGSGGAGRLRWEMRRFGSPLSISPLSANLIPIR